MGLHRYIDIARELFEEEPPFGTSIIAVLNPKGELKVAQILKDKGERSAKDPQFDAIPCWTSLNEIRIVAEVAAGGYSGDQSPSTGEYVGRLLQAVFGEEDRLIFTNRNQISVPPTQIHSQTHAYRWSEFALDEPGKRISERYSDAGLEIVEVSVNDQDYAVMKTIMDSPATQVPLKHGTRPVKFHIDGQGRITSQMAASA